MSFYFSREDSVKKIRSLKIPRNLDELFENYRNGSTQARNIGLAFDIMEKMYSENTTVFLSLAGAMTPTGAGGEIIELMRLGLIDVIASTGANLTHDLHFALNDEIFPCDPHGVNDFELEQAHTERIYDVLLHSECLPNAGHFLRELIKTINFRQPISSSKFYNILGDVLTKHTPHPDKSIIAMAYTYGVPIYCAANSDSEIGMNAALEELDDLAFKRRYNSFKINHTLDIIEQSGIFLTATQTAIIVIGGGVPKNSITQISPFVKEDLIYPNIRKDFSEHIKREADELGGLDYMIKISTDVPHFGGCSGATASENLTWKKLKPGTIQEKHDTDIHADASVVLPVLSAYAATKIKPRNKKRIYEQLMELQKLVLGIRKKRVTVLGVKSNRN